MTDESDVATGRGPQPDHVPDPVGDALRRLESADPADADEVLAAGEAAHELLQSRLRDSDSS